jgi:hypothetical protein
MNWDLMHCLQNKWLVPIFGRNNCQARLDCSKLEKRPDKKHQITVWEIWELITWKYNGMMIRLLSQPVQCTIDDSIWNKKSLKIPIRIRKSKKDHQRHKGQKDKQQFTKHYT